MKHGFTVDREKCIKCGKCMADCITGAIVADENGYPEMKNPLDCILCEHCFAICPNGAVSILEKNPADAVQSKNVNPDDVLNLIRTRRSVRNYKKMNVSKETMKKLKTMLNYTPTGCNSHRLHFSFIEDIEVMDDFRSKVNSKLISILNQKPVKFLAGISGKFSKYKDALISGEDVIFRAAPHLVVVSAPVNTPCPKEDGIIALSYFELYAASLGLGTLWCGFCQAILKFLPEFCEYLRIPEEYTPIYVMLFGYPDVNYPRSILPREYSFTTVEKQQPAAGFFAKAKRFILNFLK